MELIEPLGNGFKNYVWDTNSLNKLAADPQMIQYCHKAIRNGHRYYITTVQERELTGIPDRTLEYDNPSKWGTVQQKTFDVMESLDFKQVSCVGLLYRYFIVLDGSMRVLESSGSRIDMFNSIHNNNNHHTRDATIAEATIYHGCTLISGDGRLRNKVNRYFPDSAISFDEYKHIVSSYEVKEEKHNAD